MSITFPEDVWHIVCQFLDMDDLFTLTKISKPLRVLVYGTVKFQKYRKFQFNMRRHVGTECVAISDPKLRFFVTPSEMPVMKYWYTIAEICKVLYAKHNQSWSDLKTAAAEKQRVHDELVAAQTGRALQLEHALRASGHRRCELCRAYIQTGRGPNGEDLAEIVDTILETEFMYRHTNYASILECRLRYTECTVQNIERAKDVALTMWAAHTDEDVPTELPACVQTRLAGLGFPKK